MKEKHALYREYTLEQVTPSESFSLNPVQRKALVQGLKACVNYNNMNGSFKARDVGFAVNDGFTSEPAIFNALNRLAIQGFVTAWCDVKSKRILSYRITKEGIVFLQENL